MIVVPHPIPAVYKIRAFIVEAYIQEFTGPGCAAAEGHLRVKPFFHGHPAIRTLWCFEIFGHILSTFQK
jgi:hypothetical protein